MIPVGVRTFTAAAAVGATYLLPATRRTHSLFEVIDGDGDDIAGYRPKALAAAPGAGFRRSPGVTAAGLQGSLARDGHGHSSKEQG